MNTAGQGAPEAGGHYSFVAQYIVLNMPTSILERLYGNMDYDDLEDAILYSRLAHERTHFLQNIGTAYGLWKSHILRMAGAAALSAMHIHRTVTEQPIPLPFDDAIPRERVFDRDDEESFRRGTIAKVLLNWIKFIDGPHQVPDDHRNAHISDVSPPVSTTHVHCQDPRGVQMRLAARELIEFHARSEELLCLRHTNGISAEQRQAITHRIWADVPSQVPLRLSDRFFDVRNTDSWWASIAMTEIALNAEFPILGVKLLKPAVWEDVHPGWRFLKMCELVKKEGIPAPKKNDLTDFQLCLCDRLGWLPPTEALQSMIAGMRGHCGIDDILDLAQRVVGYQTAQPRLISAWHLDEDFRALTDNIHGPVERRTYVPNTLACALDAALQLYSAGDVICPICLGESHKKPCGVQMTVEYLGGKELEELEELEEQQ